MKKTSRKTIVQKTRNLNSVQIELLKPKMETQSIPIKRCLMNVKPSTLLPRCRYCTIIDKTFTTYTNYGSI